MYVINTHAGCVSSILCPADARVAYPGIYGRTVEEAAKPRRTSPVDGTREKGRESLGQSSKRSTCIVLQLY